MAIHTHLHGKTFSAILILLDFFCRTVTIRTQNLGCGMQSMMKHHMFRQNLLMQPRKLFSIRQEGIQTFNPRVFGQGQPMTIHAIGF